MEELKKMLFSPHFDFEEFYSYVQRKYFSGFWVEQSSADHTLRAGRQRLCGPPEDTYYHCYNFFYEYVLRDGIQVPNTTFSTSIT